MIKLLRQDIECIKKMPAYISINW